MRDLQQLADGLRGHLIAGDKVTHVTALSNGHSNETYLVHGIDKVLRMPPSAASLIERALNVRQQYELFAVLQGRPGAPPLPRLEYRCDDPGVLGDPFFLMERVDGVPGGHFEAADWLSAAEPDVQADVSRQFCGVPFGLLKVGALDVLGPPPSPVGELERWRWTVRDLRLPGLTEAFDKLAALAPATAYPPVLVHGDCVPANMLWRDAKLTAALDWELAFNGDPRWDLGYILLQFDGPGGPGIPGNDLPGLWGRDRTIAEWERASGLPAEDVMWFEAGGAAKGTAILYYGHWLWTSGQSNDERLSRWDMAGQETQAKCERLLERLSAGRHGLAPARH